jgi:ribosomal protein S18 acetylase RimI-like enzyme
MTEMMIIRPYELADKEVVLRLLRLNTPDYFSPSEENDLIHYLDYEIQNYYVLQWESQLVGCGGFNFSEDGRIGKISWDIFHPDYQRKGLGGALTRFRIQKLKEYPNIRIISVRTSQLVYKFYEKLGFELKEIAINYWAEGFDMYRMELSIEGK